MNSSRTILAAALALLVQAGAVGAQTEVYESRDAEGNAVFSDEPTPDAEAVDLGQTNMADAPSPMPEAAPPGNAAAPSPGQQGQPVVEGEDGVEYVGGYIDESPRARWDEAYRRHQGVEPGPGEPVPVEAGAAGAGWDRKQEAVDPHTYGSGPADARATERMDDTAPGAEDRGAEHAHPEHAGGRR